MKIRHGQTQRRRSAAKRTLQALVNGAPPAFVRPHPGVTYRELARAATTTLRPQPHDDFRPRGCAVYATKWLECIEQHLVATRRRYCERQQRTVVPSFYLAVGDICRNRPIPEYLFPRGCETARQPATGGFPNLCGPDSLGAELQLERRLTPPQVGQFCPKKIQPRVAVRPGAFADAIRAVTDELVVELAFSPVQVLEAQRLRYRLSSEQRGFEVEKEGGERNAFDPAARHVLVRSRLTGSILGSVRLVLSNIALDGFPMRRACDPKLFGFLPAMSTGEISRFAVARQRSEVSPAAGALVRLGLLRGLVQISAQQELTHWCALMEPALLRLLQATAIHFQAVGPVVEHHGPRQPAICTIAPMLQRIRFEQPVIWAYITGSGALWSEATTTERSPS